MCLNIQNKHEEFLENDFKLACKQRPRSLPNFSKKPSFDIPRVRIFTRKNRIWDMDNPASYNRGYFEGNFHLPMMKKRTENEKRTPRKMAEKGGCSVSQLTNRDKGITKNLKSPQGVAKNARKTQNFGRFSELFRQKWPLGGF